MNQTPFERSIHMNPFRSVISISTGCICGMPVRATMAQSSVRPPPEDFSGPDNTLGNQSDTDVWRTIRQGDPGLPSISNPTPEDGILVNAQGTWWSQIHSDQVIIYGGSVLMAVVAAIGIFFLIRGRIRIEGGRNGTSVQRFSLVQRVAHWFMAVPFLLMTLTGLLLLFGRTIAIPIVGREGFSVIATASMQAHNLFGPLFAVGLLVLSVAFVRGNLPERIDLHWLLKGGGLFGGHASAGRYNFGEKLWFWTVVFGGIALSVSGFMLLFPDTLATRDTLQWANLSHAIAAIIFIGFACGHIYLGTIGTEGTLEGMVEGEVDENWARSHHDQWFEDISAAKRGEQP